jgi:hypothetical protein
MNLCRRITYETPGDDRQFILIGKMVSGRCTVKRPTPMRVKQQCSAIRGVAGSTLQWYRNATARWQLLDNTNSAVSRTGFGDTNQEDGREGGEPRE